MRRGRRLPRCAAAHGSFGRIGKAQVWHMRCCSSWLVEGNRRGRLRWPAAHAAPAFILFVARVFKQRHPRRQRELGPALIPAAWRRQQPARGPGLLLSGCSASSAACSYALRNRLGGRPRCLAVRAAAAAAPARTQPQPLGPHRPTVLAPVLVAGIAEPLAGSGRVRRPTTSLCCAAVAALEFPGCSHAPAATEPLSKGPSPRGLGWP